MPQASNHRYPRSSDKRSRLSSQRVSNCSFATPLPALRRSALSCAFVLLPLLALLTQPGPLRLLAQEVPTLPAPQALPARAESLPLSPEERSQLDHALGSHDLNAAEKLLAAVYERNPDSPELLKTLARISFQNKNYLNAAIAFKKAEKLAPLDDPSRFTLSMAYIVLDHRDWARPELEGLAKANPKDPLYLYWLARLDYDNQSFAESIEKLRQVITMDPAFIRAYDNLGLSLEAVGSYDEAQQAYQKAIDLDGSQPPSSPWPSLNLGTMLYHLGRPQEAELHLREAVRRAPTLAQARYQLGALLQDQENFEEAVQHLAKAAELDPADPKPQYALARIYRRQGDEEKARAAFQKFEELEKKQDKNKKGAR